MLQRASFSVHEFVSADREARGPQEEWTPIILQPDSGAAGMVAFQNVHEKYLAIDEAGCVIRLQLGADGDSMNGFGSRHKESAIWRLRKKQGKSCPRKIDEAGTKFV